MKNRLMIFWKDLNIRATFFLFLFALIFITSAHSNQLRDTEIKTVIVDDYFPYTFVNDKGEPDGFSVDIIKAVAKELGMSIKIRVEIWDNALKKLSEGEFNVLPMMAYSDERDKNFDFSPPHTIAYDAYFTRKGSPKIESPNDLQGKKIIVMKNDRAHDHLKSIPFISEEQLIYENSTAGALKKLASGVGDTAVMPKVLGLVLVKKFKIENVGTSPEVVQNYQRAFSFAVNEGNSDFLGQLENGLQLIKETGEYKKIHDKWLGPYEHHKITYKDVFKYFLWVILVFVVIGGLLILWTATLRRQVSHRTKKLEQEVDERKRAEEALLMSQQRLSTVMNSIDALVYIADMQTHELLFVNEYGKRIFGDTLGQLCWKAIQQGQDGPCSFCTNHRLIDADGFPTGVYQWEFQNTFNDRWYDCRDAAIRWTDGRLVRMEIATDITDRKRDEAEREKLQSQLQQAQKMESVGRLAGGVAHDFNNILSVILGNTEIAMEDLEISHPVRENLQEINNATLRSSGIVRQLLAFARQQAIAPKVLELNETVEEMLKMLRRLIGEDIDLSWNPRPNLWPVKMDPSQVDQLLANLAVNARDAIADVGKVTIETGNVVFDEDYCRDNPGFLPGEYILLAVSDNGCGMDKETQNNLFEPFFSTKAPGKGTGLGLATVYGVVKQNNGFINVYSELNKGTTFKIYLPRSAVSTDPVIIKDRIEPTPQGSETILVVEDEPPILKMTGIMLERLGYQVLAARNPNDAIRIAQNHTGEIHLLVTDVVMPEMNGRDLANSILSLYPNLKRLFMSGYTANVIAHHGVLDEGVNFIQKPFWREQLGKKVREALDEAE